MKPPPFTYHAPRTVEEALDTLAGVGHEGKVLAGGQSLIPLLNFRLAEPASLVDINQLDELDTIEVSNGSVTVGARVRASQLERHTEAVDRIPLLGETLQLVAHPVVRNRGTVCGSLAHADPAAELPAVLRLLGGSVHVRSRDGDRDIGADDLFVGILESSLEPGELVTSATFPAPPANTGTAFVELARRHGDYALAGVAALTTVDAGRVTDARAVLIGVGPVPHLVDLSDALSGSADDVDLSAASSAVRDVIEPETDIHATADYRRHLAGVLTERACRIALDRARGAT